MKRFVSHYLFLPDYGYLKQYVIETVDGRVVRIFPYTEEIEATEWFPGVIALLTQNEALTSLDFSANKTFLTGIPPSFSVEIESHSLIPYLFYPYNFNAMQPTDGSEHKQLQ